MKRSYLLCSLVYSMLVVAFTHTQDFIVKGKVIDAAGQPIIGASIVIKGTKNGTSSIIKAIFNQSPC